MKATPIQGLKRYEDYPIEGLKRYQDYRYAALEEI